MNHKSSSRRQKFSSVIAASASIVVMTSASLQMAAAHALNTKEETTQQQRKFVLQELDMAIAHLNGDILNWLPELIADLQSPDTDAVIDHAELSTTIKRLINIHQVTISNTYVGVIDGSGGLLAAATNLLRDAKSNLAELRQLKQDLLNFDTANVFAMRVAYSKIEQVKQHWTSFEQDVIGLNKVMMEFDSVMTGTGTIFADSTPAVAEDSADTMVAV